MLSVAYCDQIWRCHSLTITELKISGYCYHSINVITLGLLQSDHFKRISLYHKLYHKVTFLNTKTHLTNKMTNKSLTICEYFLIVKDICVELILICFRVLHFTLVMLCCYERLSWWRGKIVSEVFLTLLTDYHWDHFVSLIFFISVPSF